MNEKGTQMTEKEDGGEAAKSAKSSEASPKAKKKRWPIVTAIVVVILVVGGAGFWTWHEQPSFCGAICHTPMDGYLATYEATPGQPTTDAYGADVTNATAMAACTHAQVGITCMGCHEANIGQQVSEGTAWISGGYYFPLEERSLTNLTEAVGNDDPDSFCLRSECHTNVDGKSIQTREDLKAATSDMARNPHQAQHGEVTCSDCHKAHRASTNACGQCHADAELPDGWVSYKDSQKEMADLLA